jgi:hypothetical protein
MAHQIPALRQREWHQVAAALRAVDTRSCDARNASARSFVEQVRFRGRIEAVAAESLQREGFNDRQIAAVSLLAV